MAHINFVIPLNRNDLQDTSTPGQYAVQDVLMPQAISRRLNDCKAALAECGATFILEHFDTLFSVLVHAKDISCNALETAFNIVTRGMHTMCASLPPHLEEEMNMDFRQQQLNTAKMLLYLLTELHRCFDDTVSDHNKKSMAVDAKSRKRAAETLDIDWDNIRETILTTLYSFIEMPLSKLWEPPVPEEDFVNLAANCCYRTMEDTNITQVRYKQMRESICHILGTLNRRYGHGMSCTVKMVQLLKLYEHLAAPLAEAAVLFTAEYGCRNFIRDVVRELDSEFYTGNPPKGCSLFLVELAQSSPNLVLPIMDSIVPHLDNDSYGVRSSVLSVMGEVLYQTLSAEQLNEEAREIRDSFLEHLEEHLRDVNALVRARVLKIWQQLCQQKAIPLAKLSNLLVNVIERLHDSSFPVTCRAIQLLMSLLESNPFGAKIDLPKLRENLEAETQRLAELQAELSAVLGKTPEEQWNDIFPELTPIIETTLTKKNSQWEISDDMLDIVSQKSLDELLETIADNLGGKKYFEALQVLKYAEQQFHGDKKLKCDKQIMDADAFLDLCQKIFLSMAVMRNDRSARESAAAAEAPALTAEQQLHRETVLKQRALVEFLKANVDFAEKINEATFVVSKLLLCGQTGAIQSAIEYLTAGTKFGLTVALEGFRTMLMLVWSSDTAIKDAVAEAYKTLYLSGVGEGQANRGVAAEVVRRLLALLSALNDDEQAALEILVREWVRNNDLPNACVQLLWEKFTLALPDTPEDESRAALVLLSMIAGAEVLTVKTNINVLVTVGLGERGIADYRISRDTCRMLLKLVPEVESETSDEEPFRFEKDHIIFEKLKEVLLSGFWNLKDKYYLSMAQVGLDAIYQLSDHPDKTCAEIFRSIASQIKKGKPSSGDSNQESSFSVADNVEKKVPLSVLERFLFFIGHIAYRQWTFLDRTVFRELKRRNCIREAEAEKKKGSKEQKDKRRKSLKVANPSVTPNLNQSLTRASETPRPRKEKQNDDSAIEAEFPDITADDAEAEYINSVCESEVVSETSLLGQLSPVVVDVCRNPKKYPNSKLRSTACLALTKMMLVSSVFCDEHLQLVFTLMEKAVEPEIRSNMVLAVGDLANRFPNLIEPWTKHIYSRLRDESTEVRLKTMIVLKHLVMNEMVKVRGQISDLALCIVDDDERIYSMSRVLFNELSEKGNTLYNVLPDIISCLSNPATNISEEKFRTIIEFLMPLISKNRLMESLVDKLCQRLRGSTCERQWSDIAFCLALIQYTDRSVRKLTENFICYSDKLHVDSVHESFQKILAQASKSLKGEKEALVDELRSKIEECLKRGTGENADESVDGGSDESDVEMSESNSRTPAKRSPTQGSPSQRGPPQRSSSQRGSTKRGPAQKGTGRRAPARRGVGRQRGGPGSRSSRKFNDSSESSDSSERS